MKLGELSPGQAKAAGAGGVLTLAFAALLSILPVWEGKHNAPYRDVVGKWTVCFGETEVPMRTYSDAECLTMLERRAGQFLEQVRRLNPGVAADPYQWAAHASLAYNVGIGNYARSSTLRLYKQGRQREACEAMAAWRLAGGKVWRGLVLRRSGDATRLGEIELCKTGMAK